jgi:2-amino-4-hydroxy-6-hydroxymethyldihydropteridine diphosphokinase
VSAAFVGVGANLGDPVGQVRGAIEELGRLGPTRVSSLYRTEPLGDAAQPWFINAVVEIDTSGSARALLAELRRLERRAGRPAGRPRWDPRVLDLDLLLFGDLVLQSADLTLPHAGLTTRRFVLEPLAELAPLLREPRTGKTMTELLRGLDDPLRVEKLPAASLRDPAAYGAGGPREISS